jgi:hydroxyacid-oxoacid transhydrogenase
MTSLFSTSVALTGPAGKQLCALSGPFGSADMCQVFQFTAPSSPDRHRQALAIFNSTTLSDPAISAIPDSDIGPHLFEAIARFLDGLGVPRGLKKVGYKQIDVAKLVEGTLPQRRVIDLAPGIGNVADEDGKAHLTAIIENSMEY